jgi:hypothetical protein
MPSRSVLNFLQLYSIEASSSFVSTEPTSDVVTYFIQTWIMPKENTPMIIRNLEVNWCKRVALDRLTDKRERPALRAYLCSVNHGNPNWNEVRSRLHSTGQIRTCHSVQWTWVRVSSAYTSSLC